MGKEACARESAGLPLVVRAAGAGRDGAAPCLRAEGRRTGRGSSAATLPLVGCSRGSSVGGRAA